MAKYHQGKYTVKNPSKYVGDLTNVVYRSSWELKFLLWCDSSPSVVSFSSEETIVPYRCGTDGKIHRYYLDFKIKIRDKNGNVNTYLIEIKPKSQTVPPKYTGKQTKRYLSESMTYVKNKSKWEAATQYATERGWKFYIFTEDHLGISKKKNEH